MPKSIPQLGDSNWGTPLNDHINQLQNPTTGGINTFDLFSQRPTNLTSDDAGKTYLFTQTGNIHQWTGATWKVLNESVINVKDYGAVGDGVSDDTAAVQNIVNNLINTNFKLYFPRSNGAYFFSTKVIFNNIKAFSISGDGAEVSRLESAGDLFEINGNVDHILSQFKDQIRIDGLGLITKSNYTATCLNLKNAQVYLHDLNINGKWKTCINLLHCLYSDFTRINSFSWLDNSNELTLNQGSLLGTFMEATASIANNVKSCQVAGFKYGFNFLGQIYDNHYCEGWCITDSSMFIVDYGIYAEHMTSLNISGCIFTPTGYSCVKVIFGVAVQVINCFFEGTNAPNGNNLNHIAIDFGITTTSCSIIGNQISGGNENGRGYSIDGNNHTVSFNRFNFSGTTFQFNQIYGNNHTVFCNVGRGSENTFSNGYVGNLTLNTIIEYLGNADALSAGLRPGSMYRTGDILKIVH